VKVTKVLSEFGNRVYCFAGKNIPKADWMTFTLGEYRDQASMFLEVKDDGVVTALVHACPQLPEGARYAWQARLYKQPLKPAACPRCRYRMDYVPKHGV
jgi:hypothetical protein